MAAITLSQRVSQEMNTDVGAVVGYTVRFEDVTSENTKLKYLTDGMLLREAMLGEVCFFFFFLILFKNIKHVYYGVKVKKTNVLESFTGMPLYSICVCKFVVVSL